MDDQETILMALKKFEVRSVVTVVMYHTVEADENATDEEILDLVGDDWRIAKTIDSDGWEVVR
jgi:hypothetical protein